MMESKSKEVFRAGLLSLWGMATLVLLFCLSFLVYDLVQQGRDPLNFSVEDIPVGEAEEVAPPEAESKLVRLYFADAGGRYLEAEDRVMKLGADTVENCRSVLSALIDGPRDALTPILPPNAKVRGMYHLESGELVIDFGRELEAAQIKSATAELFMVRGIVATMTQVILRGTEGGPVQSVRLLFEGAAAQDRFPAHIDVGETIRLDPLWINRPVDRTDDV